MAAINLVSSFLKINCKPLTKEEKRILEADLLISICNELKLFFMQQNNFQFDLIINGNVMEDKMLDFNYVHWILKDILITGDYTISGIAYHTETPEDVIFDLLARSNLRPSAIFLQRLIELHREVKRELYISIKKKITKEYISLLADDIANSD